MRTTDAATSRPDAPPATALANMRTGVKKGTSDRTTASVESGSWITGAMKIMGTSRSMTTGNWACWASSSVLQVAPTAA